MIGKQEKAYTLLAIVEKTEIAQKSGMFVSTDELNVANRCWVNQIKTDRSFHFDTSGKIFGLGYGPKYAIDRKTNLSIGQFGGKRKLLTDDESSKQILFKKKIFAFSCLTIDHIFSTFRAAQSNLSPNISKLQIHFDLYCRTSGMNGL